MAKEWPDMNGLELATKVTCEEAQTVEGDGKYKVAAFDYGIKQNILNSFKKRGCTVRVFPAKSSIEEIKQ